MTDRSFLPPQDYDSDFVDRIIFGEKLCPTCEVAKPRNTEHFHRDESEPGRLNRECHACRLRRQREIRAAV